MSDPSSIRLGDRLVGPAAPPFIVAELSGNHNGSLTRALEIVSAAAEAGAHALKLQTYTADTMTLDVEAPGFRIEDPASPWHGRSLHELYDEAHTPWDWHRPIFDRCRELGLVGFSAPFDATAVAFLEELEVPCYKIASFENVDLPLIRRVAATGKPLVISTGMASVAEIEEAVRAAREAGCRELILLKCSSAYPAPPESANLATLEDMRRRFACLVGLSDHTRGVSVSVAAVALGAVMIEKHFTLRRADGGVDSAFSLEPDELRSLVLETELAWRAAGEVSYGPTASELPSLQFRRSLYVVEDIRAGETIRSGQLRAIRPGFGLPPKELDRLVGRRAARDAARGTPATWDLVGGKEEALS